MFISLDVETTGFDTEKDKIIEFGAVKFKGEKIIDTLQIFINPGREIPKIVTHITGITEADTANAQNFEQVKEEIKKFVGKTPIIGHNIHFDIDFLQSEGLELDNKLYDTCKLSQLLLDAPSYSLEVLTEKLKLSHKDKHRALDDSIACMHLLNLLLGKIEEIPVPTLEEIKLLASKSDWELEDLFVQAQGGAEPSKEEEQEEKEAQNENINIEFTEKLLETFEDQKNLVCEASIGSKRKKSLLSAATIQSQKNHERIVISVFDKESEKELKALSDTKATILGSHENYLSIHRLEQFKQKERLEEPELTLVIKVLLWDTKYGEQGELNLTRDERALFKYIACDMKDCDHSDSKIKDSCYFAKIREKAIDSDIIITNHRFLLDEQSKEIIPPYRYLMIDEADRLEEAGVKIQTFVPETLENRYPKEKVEMLFGLIGIFLQKYKDPSKWQLIMDEYHYRVIDWQKISQLAKSIDEELGEIFAEDYSQTKINWMFQGYEDRICFKTATIQANETLKELIESKKSTILTSSTLLIDNSFEFIKKTLEIENYDFEELVYPPRFNENEKLEITPPPRSLPPQYSLENLEYIAKTIITNTLKNEGKCVVLSTSKKHIGSLHSLVAQPLKEKGINVLAQGVSGGFGKIIDTFSNNPESNILICNFDFWLYANIKGANCMIVTKLPFSPPDEPIYFTKSKLYKNSFTEYGIPKTLLKFRQATHKLIKLNNPTTSIVLLDNKISEKDYGQKFLTNIPKN
jgi:DNA polymerase III epsilon subunit family exonuclease